MAYEPDVLEACDTLQLRVTAAPAARGSSGGGGGGARAVAAAVAAARGGSVAALRSQVVCCPFAHEKVFDHYQQVNKDFWVHEAELASDQ